MLDDHSLVFTGDALLVRGCGRCDFQQGDAATQYHSITGQILSLPDHCLLYPAHDSNARLGGEADERGFVGSIENLHLHHPNRIAVALPANLRSGRPADGGMEEADDWAPIERSYAGLPELTADWVADHREALTLVDVRSEAEVQGPDGRIPGSLLIPLPELQARAGEIPTDRPTVVLCHSGSRSALATQQLQKKGLSHVANLRGGLRAWKAQGLALEHPA